MSLAGVEASRLGGRINQLAATALATSVAYCGLELLQLTKPKDAFGLFLLSNFNGQVKFIFAAIVWLALVALAVIRHRLRFPAGFLWTAAVFLLVGGVVSAYNPVTFLDTAELNGYTYYLVDDYDLSSKWHAYSLCECAGLNGSCQCHRFFNAYSPIMAMDFSIAFDHSAQSMEVLLNDGVLYSFGRAQRCIEPANLIGYCEAD